MKRKRIERDDYFGLGLVSPVFLEAVSAIYRTALSRLERDFGFSAAVRTGDLVHSSAAESSFFAHFLLNTTLQISYAPDITQK